MSAEPWPVKEGSLALGLIVNFIHHQVGTDKLSRADAETILRNTVSGADNPGAQASVRYQLKQVFPHLNF
jgi:hypothetical protein